MLDHQIDAQVQTGLRMEVRTLVERATRWLVNNRRRPIDIGAAVGQLAAGVQAVEAALPTLLTGRDAEALAQRLKGYRAANVPDDLAPAVAVLHPAYAALTIVQTADREGLDVVKVAEVHFTLGQRLGLDRLLTRIVELPRDDRWQTMARAALRDDLHAVHALLTAQVLAGDGGEEPFGPGAGGQLGEDQCGGARFGAVAALGDRQPGRPGPDLGGPAYRPGSAAKPYCAASRGRDPPTSSSLGRRTSVPSARGRLQSSRRDRTLGYAYRPAHALLDLRRHR